MKVLSILLLLLSACAHAPRIEEHGWTRFRGPNGRGVATDDAYPVRIGPDSHVRWQVEFAPGYSSPVLNESLVFLTASEGERLFTYAVEQDTGKIAWRREAPRERRTEFHAKNHAAAASAPGAASGGGTQSSAASSLSAVSIWEGTDLKWPHAASTSSS